MKFTVIRDSKEKKGYWDFAKSEICNGIEVAGLKTGDYTIKGMEDVFSIERKASTGEFANNVLSKRFCQELLRGRRLKHFWVVCEFSLEDILKFPYNSGIPYKIWPKIKVSASFLLKKIVELQVKYRVNIIFAGNKQSAEVIALSLFKEMNRLYEKDR